MSDPRLFAFPSASNISLVLNYVTLVVAATMFVALWALTAAPMASAASGKRRKRRGAFEAEMNNNDGTVGGDVATGTGKGLAPHPPAPCLFGFRPPAHHPAWHLALLPSKQCMNRSQNEKK